MFDRLLPCDFEVDHLLDSEMGLVDSFLREPQQDAVITSTKDEQLIVAKLVAVKRSAKCFLLNTQNFTDFAEQKRQLNPTQIVYIQETKTCFDFAAKAPTFLKEQNCQLDKRIKTNQPSKTQQTFHFCFLPLITLQLSRLQLIQTFKRLLSHFKHFNIRQTKSTQTRFADKA